MKRTPVLLVLFLLTNCFFTSVRAEGQESSVTFVAVGDIMLGRYIGKVMTARSNNYPFEEVMSVLRNGDIVFGNLESIIGGHYADPYYKDKPYNFIASPSVAKTLHDAGFNILNLANNHAMDFGPEALEETRRLLKQEEMEAFGAGKDISDARKPAIISMHGLRFGFPGYGVGHSRKAYAKWDRPGIAPILLNDIRKDILTLRRKVDVLIVSLHWGKEYEKFPTRQQQNTAHQIIDWGADMIIGHHPHVMQGIEIYNGKLIAYSLGNFIFDQRGNGTERSIMLVCSFRRNTFDSHEIIPIDRSRNYFPRVATGEVRKQILKEIHDISLPLNTKPGDLNKIGLH